MEGVAVLVVLSWNIEIGSSKREAQRHSKRTAAAAATFPYAQFMANTWPTIDFFFGGRRNRQRGL